MSDTHSGIEIPQRFKDCVLELALVCRKHGIGFLRGEIKPAFNDPWRDNFTFEYNEGCHGPPYATMKTEVRENLKLPQ